MRVWKGLGKFRGESSISTWIFTITRRTCLDSLKAREAVVLFYLEDRSYEEVTETMGVPMGTVKTLLFRARKQMIEQIIESKLRRSAK